MLAAEGRREVANRILFAARTAERKATWRELRHPNKVAHERKMEGLPPEPDHALSLPYRLGNWLGLMLFWSIGYGIGEYSLLALVPLVCFTLLGTLTLYFSAGLADRPILECKHSRLWRYFVGFLWRAGASFQKVLPLIEFYKPFKEFLDNPEPTDGLRRNLNGFQVFVFSVLSIFGWILGGFVVAAIGGLTQKG